MARTFVSSNPDYISYGDNHDIGLSDWAVVSLVRTSASGASQVILSKNALDPTYNLGWMLYITSGGNARLLLAGGGVSGTIVVTSTATVNDGNWHLIGANYDRSGNGTVWIDSGQDGSGSISALSAIDIQTSFNLLIGADDNPANYFDGEIAWTAAYNRLLDTAELTELNVTRNAQFITRGRIFMAHLLGSNVNDMHGLTGSVTGTPSVSAHPRMWMPSSPRAITFTSNTEVTPSPVTFSMNVPAPYSTHIVKNTSVYVNDPLRAVGMRRTI